MKTYDIYITLPSNKSISNDISKINENRIAERDGQKINALVSYLFVFAAKKIWRYNFPQEFLCHNEQSYLKHSFIRVVWVIIKMGREQ